MQRHIKIIVEKHSDGFVAYPVGLKGIVVAEGDTYEEALTEVKSAIEFHIETFGREVLEVEEMAQEVFVAEAGVSIESHNELIQCYNDIKEPLCPEQSRGDREVEAWKNG